MLRTYIAAFGRSRTGLTTVGYRLYDSANDPVGARITDGIYEIGDGAYGALVEYADDFEGSIRWNAGLNPDILLSEAVNQSQDSAVRPVSVRVVHGNAGLGGATVELFQLSSGEPVRGSTNSNGLVALSVAGNFALVASRTGWVMSGVQTLSNGVIQVSMMSDLPQFSVPQPVAEW